MTLLSILNNQEALIKQQPNPVSYLADMDRFLDIIPVISVINNLANIIIKNTSYYALNKNSNPYFRYLSSKNNNECALKMIPIVGQIMAINDGLSHLAYKNMAKKAAGDNYFNYSCLSNYELGLIALSSNTFEGNEKNLKLIRQNPQLIEACAIIRPDLTENFQGLSREHFLEVIKYNPRNFNYIPVRYRDEMAVLVCEISPQVLDDFPDDYLEQDNPIIRRLIPKYLNKCSIGNAVTLFNKLHPNVKNDFASDFLAKTKMVDILKGLSVEKVLDIIQKNKAVIKEIINSEESNFNFFNATRDYYYSTKSTSQGFFILKFLEHRDTSLYKELVFHTFKCRLISYNAEGNYPTAFIISSAMEQIIPYANDPDLLTLIQEVCQTNPKSASDLLSVIVSEVFIKRDMLSKELILTLLSNTSDRSRGSIIFSSHVKKLGSDYDFLIQVNQILPCICDLRFPSLTNDWYYFWDEKKLRTTGLLETCRIRSLQIIIHNGLHETPPVFVFDKFPAEWQKKAEIRAIFLKELIETGMVNHAHLNSFLRTFHEYEMITNRLVISHPHPYFPSESERGIPNFSGSIVSDGTSERYLKIQSRMMEFMKGDKPHPASGSTDSPFLTYMPKTGAETALDLSKWEEAFTALENYLVAKRRSVFEVCRKKSYFVAQAGLSYEASDEKIRDFLYKDLKYKLCQIVVFMENRLKGSGYSSIDKDPRNEDIFNRLEHAFEVCAGGLQAELSQIVDQYIEMPENAPFEVRVGYFIQRHAKEIIDQTAAKFDTAQSVHEKNYLEYVLSHFLLYNTVASDSYIVYTEPVAANKARYFFERFNALSFLDLFADAVNRSMKACDSSLALYLSIKAYVKEHSADFYAAESAEDLETLEDVKADLECLKANKKAFEDLQSQLMALEATKKEALITIFSRMGDTIEAKKAGALAVLPTLFEGLTDEQIQARIKGFCNFRKAALTFEIGTGKKVSELDLDAVDEGTLRTWILGATDPLEAFIESQLDPKTHQFNKAFIIQLLTHSGLLIEHSER